MNQRPRPIEYEIHKELRSYDEQQILMRARAASQLALARRAIAAGARRLNAGRESFCGRRWSRVWNDELK